MSNHAIELLEAFETLTPVEKHSFAIEIFRRTREVPFESGSISDEEIGESGRSLFAFLDQEEHASPSR